MKKDAKYISVITVTVFLLHSFSEIQVEESLC